MYAVCECGEETYSRTTFYKHKKNCKLSINSGKFLCKEDNCKFNSRYAANLHQHLQCTHGIDCKDEIKIFDNYSDFLNWKEQYEKETKSSYILRSIRKLPTGRKVYFYCNRSGKYVSNSTGKRLAKSQGLSKIGFNCPSRLVVHDIKEPESTTVYVHNYHYGHENQLAHIRIPKSDRDVIAHQLTQGINASRVLINLFSDNESNLQRRHLCTKRDMLNISKSYGIEKIKKHSDHISVDAYVKENLENDRSIFLYKKQGEEIFQYPEDETCILDKNDFVLGVMTAFQKQLLTNFGNNIICVDATHGTKMYKFNLITIIVVDEFREGIPVGWLLCNKENATVLRLFFNSIKKEIGDIHPEIFMSDKAPQYFSSWREVFQAPSKKLLCHWHIHQDWKRNLNKIKNKTLVTTLYKELCLLLEERDEEKFDILLEKYCLQLKENFETQYFYKYFIKEWVLNKKEWAKCYRLGCDINTNMFVESFHKMIKYGKHGKRVDKCLFVLLKFAKDLAIKRLIKSEKDENTWKSSEINEHHRLTLSLPTTLVKKTSSITGEVQSEKCLDAEALISDNEIYKVKEEPASNKNCQIICQECDICLHSHSCSCPDALTVINICKHINLVNQYRKTMVSEIETFEIQNITSQQNYEVDQNFIYQIRKPNPETNIEALKTSLIEKNLELNEKIRNCDDKDILLAVKQNINSSISIVGTSQLKSNPCSNDQNIKRERK